MCEYMAIHYNMSSGQFDGTDESLITDALFVMACKRKIPLRSFRQYCNQLRRVEWASRHPLPIA